MFPISRTNEPDLDGGVKKAKKVKKISKEIKSSQKKKKKSKKSSSSDSEKEEGEISSDTDEDPTKLLTKAVAQKKNTTGVWTKIFPNLNTADLGLLVSTEELFREIYQPLYNVSEQGGSVIITFNKSVEALETRWKILKKSVDARKAIPSEEKKAITEMIEATLDFLENFKKDFNSSSYTKAAISSLINVYDDNVVKALLGKSVCQDVIVKLKGLQKSNRGLMNVSWGKLSSYQPAGNNRGYSKKWSQQGNYYQNKNYAYNNGGYNYNSGYAGSYYGGGYYGNKSYNDGYNGQSSSKGSGKPRM